MYSAIVFLPLLGAIIAGIIAIVGAARGIRAASRDVAMRTARSAMPSFT